MVPAPRAAAALARIVARCCTLRCRPKRRLAAAMLAVSTCAALTQAPVLRAAETGEGLRQRGEAGYRFRDLRSEEADSLGLLPPGGVLVTSVGPGTAADVAG